MTIIVMTRSYHLIYQASPAEMHTPQEMTSPTTQERTTEMLPSLY